MQKTPDLAARRSYVGLTQPDTTFQRGSWLRVYYFRETKICQLLLE
jgi:hypothetical protein